MCVCGAVDGCVLDDRGHAAGRDCPHACGGPASAGHNGSQGCRQQIHQGPTLLSHEMNALNENVICDCYNNVFSAYLFASSNKSNMCIHLCPFASRRNNYK